MQAFACVADFVGEAAFDIHVHVFQIERPFQAACLDFGGDFRHAALDGGKVVGGKHARFVQHLGVGERALDVPSGEPLVKTDGAGVLFDQFGYGFVEASRPSFLWGCHGVSFGGGWKGWFAASLRGAGSLKTENRFSGCLYSIAGAIKPTLAL